MQRGDLEHPVWSHPRRFRTEPLFLAFAVCFFLSAVAAAAPVVVPVSLSQVGCSGITFAKRLEVPRGSANVECSDTVSDGVIAVTVESSGSTFYPGGGLSAAASAEATMQGRATGPINTAVGQGQLTYYLRVGEKLPPPFVIGSIPVKLEITGEFRAINAGATVAVGGIGLADELGPGYGFIRSSRGLNDNQKIKELVSQEVPIEVLLGIKKFALCTVSIGQSTSLSSCFATIDPVVTFDQARFDEERLGEQTFLLADYYELVYSPVPEPQTYALMVVGLAFLTAMARRQRPALHTA